MNIFGTNVNKKGKREKNQKVQEGPCIFPFKHQWKEHDECIDNDDKGKICATSVSERGTLKTYGYCNEREKISVKSSSRCSIRISRPKIILVEPCCFINLIIFFSCSFEESILLAVKYK